MSITTEEAPVGHDQSGHHHGGHCRTVDIHVNNSKVVLHAGRYEVPTLKTVSGVPLADDLDQLVECKLKHIPDDGTVHIEGCEIFISHVKGGGSS